MSYIQNNGVKEITSNLFSTVNFYLIGKVDPKAEKMLLDGGAHKFQYLSDILTHCIAESVDEEVVEAKELYQLIVVKSSWIRLSLQCNTLLPYVLKHCSSIDYFVFFSMTFFLYYNNELLDIRTKPFDVDAKNLLSGVTVCPSQVCRN
ncbi:hypothetical protein HELRODRAFT_171399 [Helobdella robusta]|uniref:BRCT domain-containing protein n=1 Tax=Helobdella robusta TaxID=6412 RepID=T1F482_HELRO|nr:hypothetical protein HELRODRAFT_171399 [Helobdella robusta]ESO05731.1 hypothetical protein HELRODRAFT_171399 [Helobdella robusta]